MKTYDETYIRLANFMHMAYSACRIPMWCFSLKGKLYISTCPEEQSFSMILRLSGCLAYALSPERYRDRPVVLSDTLGLLWIADYLVGENAPDLLVILGPYFSSKSALKWIGQAMFRQNISPEISVRLMRVRHQIPVLNRDMQQQYAAMLHCSLLGEPFNYLEMEYQHGSAERDSSLSSSTEREPAKPRHHLVSATSEERIFQAIREGEIGLKKRLSEEENCALTMQDIIHYGYAQTDRDEKNASIVFAALCARAATEGGLSEELALELRTKYITEIEHAKTVTDLYALSERMTNAFIRSVASVRKSERLLSEVVQKACAYIQKHLDEEIELEAMARELHYSKYYLSKKFCSEMGLRLSEYIAKKKIELAQILLATTDLDIWEVSDRLSFGSRDYFTKTFRKVTGVSPMQYREKKSIQGASPKPPIGLI